MNNSVVFIFLYLSGVLISSISQVMLKKSAGITRSSMLKEYLNFYVITAYAIFFLSTFMTIYAYKHVALSLGPILESAGYIFVIVLSCLFLHEKISKRQFIGIAAILLGIIISTYHFA